MAPERRQGMKKKGERLVQIEEDKTTEIGEGDVFETMKEITSNPWGKLVDTLTRQRKTVAVDAIAICVQ